MISQLNSAIQNQWSGTFGRYNVTTTVTGNPSWYNIVSARNSVQLVNNPQGGSPVSQVVGGNTGTWYQPGQGNPIWEARHEGGHLMGLPDQYRAVTVNGQRTTVPNPGFANNVMGAYGATGVTETDISNVINANAPWYTKAWNTITNFLGGSTPAAQSGSANAAENGGLSTSPSLK